MPLRSKSGEIEEDVFSDIVSRSFEIQQRMLDRSQNSLGGWKKLSPELWLQEVHPLSVLRERWLIDPLCLPFREASITHIPKAKGTENSTTEIQLATYVFENQMLLGNSSWRLLPCDIQQPNNKLCGVSKKLLCKVNLQEMKITYVLSSSP